MQDQPFIHDALLYQDDADFVSGTAEFLRAGLNADEAALVATDEHKIGLLREELGDTNGSIKYVNMHLAGRNPARIIQVWRDFLDDHPGTVRGVGEPVWNGRDAEELVECHIHEMLLNYAFGGRKNFNLLCPYEAPAFDDAVLHNVACTHGPDNKIENPFIGSLPDPPSNSTQLGFDGGSLKAVRGLCSEQADLFGVEAERAAEIVLAVHEVTSNSVSHGDGTGELACWREDDALMFNIRDSGQFSDPLAGRIFPEAIDDSGRGLWLANQLVDLLQIRSDETGSTVRLTIRKH
jgi:anti-sigma regulatory factor (Ser/Thr protein kinase)